MNYATESVGSVLYEFSDEQCSRGLAISCNTPQEMLRPFLRRHVLPEQALQGRRDLAELSALVRKEKRASLHADDAVGVCHCLANLAIIAKLNGERPDWQSFAE